MFWNLHDPIFEEFFVTDHQDRYDLMCGLHAYYKENDKSTDEKHFCGGRPIPDDSTTISLVSLCVSNNFIDTCLNVLPKIIRGIVVLINRRRKKYF